MEVVFTSITGFLGDHLAPRHERKDSRLSIVPIAQFVVGIAGKVGVVIGGCAVLPISSWLVFPLAASSGASYLDKAYACCCTMFIIMAMNREVTIARIPMTVVVLALLFVAIS